MKTLKPTLHTKLAVAALAFASTCTLLFTAGNVLANPYGTNITINDGTANYGTGVGQEDNEAEHGMVQSQAWDLEGFLLTDNRGKLTIIGGYNFYTGNQSLYAGDIFIDTDNNAVHSPGVTTGLTTAAHQTVSNGLFKYDYVLDINWATGEYSVIKLTADSLLTDTVYGSQYNAASNPWRYLSGGTAVAGGSGLLFDTYNKASQTDTYTGFSGWNGDNKHYVASFDISKIDLNNGALFHNTMECGNDNLLGQVAPVPEPATMLLFGTGIAGLAGIVRRRRMHN